MRNKFYKCDGCSSSFSRKWNALRHNKLKHSNSAQIFNDNIKPEGLCSRSQQVL
jgi:hypothetical protein